MSFPPPSTPPLSSQVVTEELGIKMEKLFFSIVEEMVSSIFASYLFLPPPPLHYLRRS